MEMQMLGICRYFLRQVVESDGEKKDGSVRTRWVRNESEKSEEN